MKEHQLQAFDSEMFRKIFASKEDGISEQFRIPHNEEPNVGMWLRIGRRTQNLAKG
jgi:hypothetical protein